MVSDGVPLMRRGVLASTAPMRWIEFKRISGISYHTARRLEVSAHRPGSNPFLWRCSFEPLSIDKWRAIQVYRDAGWVDTGILERLRENACSGVITIDLFAGPGALVKLAVIQRERIALGRFQPFIVRECPYSLADKASERHRGTRSVCGCSERRPHEAIVQRIAKPPPT